MSDVKPVEKELTVEEGIEKVRLTIIKQLEIMNGKIAKSDKTYIECNLGSLFWSRIIGEFFVPKTWLPKRAEIHLDDIESNKTKVKILVKDTHKYGVKWGYVKKYNETLQDVAESIVKSIEK